MFQKRRLKVWPCFSFLCCHLEFCGQVFSLWEDRNDRAVHRLQQHRVWKLSSSPGYSNTCPHEIWSGRAQSCEINTREVVLTVVCLQSKPTLRCSVSVQHDGEEGSNWLAPRDPFCSIGFCLVPKGVLENATSFSSGDLNAILGSAGLKGMSARGLEKRARIKKWGNNGRKSGRTTPSKQKKKGQMKSDTLYANKSCQKC